jgi:hypothetical protein
MGVVWDCGGIKVSESKKKKNLPSLSAAPVGMRQQTEGKEIIHPIHPIGQIFFLNEVLHDDRR